MKKTKKHRTKTTNDTRKKQKPKTLQNGCNKQPKTKSTQN